MKKSTPINKETCRFKSLSEHKLLIEDQERALRRRSSTNMQIIHNEYSDNKGILHSKQGRSSDGKLQSLLNKNQNPTIYHSLKEDDFPTA